MPYNIVEAYQFQSPKIVLLIIAPLRNCFKLNKWETVQFLANFMLAFDLLGPTNIINMIMSSPIMFKKRILSKYRYLQQDIE